MAEGGLYTPADEAGYSGTNAGELYGYAPPAYGDADLFAQFMRQQQPDPVDTYTDTGWGKMIQDLGTMLQQGTQVAAEAKQRAEAQDLFRVVQRQQAAAQPIQQPDVDAQLFAESLKRAGLGA